MNKVVDVIFKTLFGFFLTLIIVGTLMFIGFLVSCLIGEVTFEDLNTTMLIPGVVISVGFFYLLGDSITR